MKQQISRLSPHQNGKVAGVLSAVVSLIVVPMTGGIEYDSSPGAA